MNKNEKEIKLKCLEIQVKNIDSKLQTLTWLDYKIWIFLGFFFLIFFENLKFLNDSNLCIFKVSAVIFFILSLYFLFESIFLKKIDKLYPNIDNAMNYDWRFEIEWFIKHRYQDYIDIDWDIDELIDKRNNSFKLWVIMFLISLIPAIIYFLIK